MNEMHEIYEFFLELLFAGNEKYILSFPEFAVVIIFCMLFFLLIFDNILRAIFGIIESLFSKWR